MNEQVDCLLNWIIQWIHLLTKTKGYPIYFYTSLYTPGNVGYYAFQLSNSDPAASESTVEMWNKYSGVEKELGNRSSINPNACKLSLNEIILDRNRHA